ncbi:MAG: ADP-ribosylglycohydrolase family protein [Promethearchaeota archaeon]|nr:MAG: ADP-ribosylglycohydrolase family protein [Candidatus Lokiarchaeota archaeon]
MLKITSQEYYNKVLGSWLGRISGDHVGAPVEFMPSFDIKNKYGEITYYPEPIDLNYVNDDEMYEICALIALEKNGIDMTSKHIAQEWIDLLYKFNFTAEKVALKNLRSGIWPPESGIHENVYHDAIGAQMRADIWGQISPGCPEIAKEYAKIDGCISHAGIGIQGEVFIAILISQAFFNSDITENIQFALRLMPSESESSYTQMVLSAREIYEQYSNDFRKARRKLVKYWRQILNDELIPAVPPKSKQRLSFLTEYIPEVHTPDVHVLPNIGIIILSLLFGGDDKEDPLGKSICIAAMMGFDTDCNCGNIGAIIGAQLGADKIPSKWKDPLQDTFSTYVKGHEKWKISQLAQRIADIGKLVTKNKCQNKVTINE